MAICGDFFCALWRIIAGVILAGGGLPDFTDRRIEVSDFTVILRAGDYRRLQMGCGQRKRGSHSLSRAREIARKGAWPASKSRRTPALQQQLFRGGRGAHKNGGRTKFEVAL